METPLSVLPLRYGDDEPDFVTSETYIPDDPGRRDFGQFFLSLRLSRPASFQTALAASIMETLRDAFYSNPEQDAAEAFERSLKVINEKLSPYVEERGPDFFSELHVAIAVLSGSTLHVTVAGNASVYLKRGPNVVSVSEGLIPAARSPEERKTFFHIASGDIRLSDQIIVSTNDLLVITTEHHVRAALQPQNFRTPRLLKAKLGIRDADQVLILSGESLSKNQFAASGLIDSASTWTEKIKRAFRGTPSQNDIENKQSPNEPQNDNAKPQNDLASLYEKPEGPTKFQNTWGLFRSNLRRSLDSVSRKFSGQPLTKKGSRNAAVIALVIILMLVAALFWTLDLRSRTTAKSDVLQQLDEIIQDRQTAQTTSIYDKTTAKSVLSKALLRATELKLQNTVPEIATDIDKEIKAIEEVLNRVDNIFVYDDPIVAVDLSQVRNGIDAKGLFVGGGSIWAFDYNALYKIDLDKVDRRKIEIPDMENVKVIAAAYMTQTQTVVMTTEDKKVIEYKDGNFSVIDNAGGEWKSAIDMAEYDQRPLVYFLDSQEKQLWKYQRNRSNFSAPAAKVPTEVDMTKAISAAIDGSVYVLMSDGLLSKSYNDKVADFDWENFSDTTRLTQPTRLLTNSNTNYLYILEPATKRIVVTSKTGRYLAQYVLPKADNLVSMVVRESESMISVLADSGKIYNIPLESFSN